MQGLIEERVSYVVRMAGHWFVVDDGIFYLQQQPGELGGLFHLEPVVVPRPEVTFHMHASKQLESLHVALWSWQDYH